MSLPHDDHVDEWRRLFPVSAKYAYLNHAAVSPISRPVRDAMVDLADDVMEHGLVNVKRWYATVEATRRAAAALLRTEPKHVAFAKNTSEGLSFVAAGYPWQRGDEVVTSRAEFPSNRFPWLNLADLGVRTILVDDDAGCLPAERLLDALTPRTRVLAVSAVQYVSGYRADLAALGEACAERDVLFVIDGIQAIGAQPLHPEEIGADVVAADAHKWMLGPEGIGIVYLSDRALDALRVTEVGWASAANAGDFEVQDFVLHPDARRFEPGTPTTIALYGLRAALDLINGVGLGMVAERVLALADHARHAARDRGWGVYGPQAGPNRSGIVSVEVPGDTDRLQRDMWARGVIVSSRGGRIRLSPHFYNTALEIDHAYDTLASLA